MMNKKEINEQLKGYDTIVLLNEKFENMDLNKKLSVSNSSNSYETRQRRIKKARNIEKWLNYDLERKPYKVNYDVNESSLTEVIYTLKNGKEVMTAKFRNEYLDLDTLESKDICSYQMPVEAKQYFSILGLL